jgi:hypothetical protein
MLMRFVSLGFATLASGRDVTGSGSCMYDKGYCFMIKSYSSFVVKFTTGVEFLWSFCRTIYPFAALIFSQTIDKRQLLP